VTAITGFSGQGGCHSIVTTADEDFDHVYERKSGVATHPSVNVYVDNVQWLKYSVVNRQSPKISLVSGQTPKRADQIFDLQLHT